MTSRRVGLVLAIGSVFVALAVTPYVLQQTTSAAANSLPVLASIGDFELIGQDGRPFSSADLAGNVWVADFMFTRCPGACPQMTSTLAGVFKDFDSHKDLQMVSISVDPEFDTPEILTKFAESYGADPTRWHFLTGPNDFIQQLSEHDFKIAAAETPGAHSLRYILVDRKSNVRGYYHSDDPEDVQRLRSDLAKLLASGA